MLEKIKKIITPVLLALVLVFAGTSYYFFSQLSGVKKDPQKAMREEVNLLLAKVSRLIILPENEEPTVATVSDPERLKDQAFFSKAKIGDKVLIYTNAKKAILYDPKADKIIEVAPINIGTTNQAPPVPSLQQISTTTPGETQ